MTWPGSKTISKRGKEAMTGGNKNGVVEIKKSHN